ncbi:MAG: protein kinase [Verrucomicrobia bacterium]|nr:protein kinase [Verrucomicrobiota bacterium]
MRTCEKCGTRLGTYSPQDLCPRCLLADGLDAADNSQLSTLNSQPSSRRFADYELLEEIAHGGMGVVWKARQAGLNRIVALKLMLAGPWAGADFTRRFRAEAEAVSSLQHPNIVAIHEVGEQDGQPFFSMDFVEGCNLAGLVREHPLPARQAATYLKTIAEAVQYAHQHGVLHRDLKPSNILVDTSDQPRITDFGLAKRFGVETERELKVKSGSSSAPGAALNSQLSTLNPQLTLPGQVLGSPNYLPPEQAEGRVRDIGPASDVYSLGAVLYHLLTGRAPFQAATVTDVLRQVVQADPPPLRLLNSSVPRDLETICLKCLEKDLHRRYASAQGLADELGRFLRDEPIQARPVSRVEKLWRWCKRRPVYAGLIAALVGVFVLGVAGVLWQWGRAERNATAAETALRDAHEALWQANFERAHAWRISGQMGQRVQALAAIRSAAALRPSAELRTEAIAAFALLDLEDSGTWHPLPRDLVNVQADDRGERYLIALPDDRFEVRRIVDGALLAALTNRTASQPVELRLSGSRLASSGKERSFVWDLNDGRMLFDQPGYYCLALSPGGKHLFRASQSNGAVVVDLDTQAETARLPDSVRPEFAVFSPQGDRVALWSRTWGGKAVEVWDLTTQQKEGELLLSNLTSGVDWRPDGLDLAVGCGDRLIHVWRIKSGLIQTLRGHLQAGLRPFYHPQGDLLASVAWDETLRLWSPEGGVQVLGTHAARPLGFSADGQWLVVRGPRGIGRLRLHRPAECRLLQSGLRKALLRSGLNFSPDGQWLVGQGSGQFVVWNVSDGRMLARVSLPDGYAVGFLDSQTLLTVRAREGLQMFTANGPPDAGRVAAHHHLVPDEGRFTWGALSRDQHRLVVRLDGNGAVFDFSVTGGWEPSSNVDGAAYSALPHEPPTAPRLRLIGQPFFSHAEFSPDGQWIASGSRNLQGNFGAALWFWSARDGQPMHRIPVGNCNPHFSPDGRWFLAAGSPEYRLYAVAGPPAQWREVWREPREVFSFTAGPARFAAHRDWVALLADERIIRLIEVTSRRELARLTPLTPRVEDLAWSLDGRWLAASSELGTHLWDLPLLRVRLRELGLDWE